MYVHFMQIYQIKLKMTKFLMANDLSQIIIIKIYCIKDVKIQLFQLNLNKIYKDCHIFLEYF